MRCPSSIASRAGVGVGSPSNTRIIPPDGDVDSTLGVGYGAARQMAEPGRIGIVRAAFAGDFLRAVGRRGADHGGETMAAKYGRVVGAASMHMINHGRAGPA